jgi:predicted nuclease of predicted toxin-antitoxin system
MKFLMDRNVDMRVVNALRTMYNWAIDDSLTRASNETRSDMSVLEAVIAKGCVLLTQDRDFSKAELKQKACESHGVVLIRLFGVVGKDATNQKAELVYCAVTQYTGNLRGRILVVEPNKSYLMPPC